MAGSDRRVRYYSPSLEKRVLAAVPSLCSELLERHKIETEVIPVRLVPGLLNGAMVPDEAHEKEIYDRDFWPRWQVLNAHTGTRIGKVLRSNSGNHFVAGVVAISSDEGLEWYAAPGNQFSAYDEDSRLGFLKALLAKGPPLLVDLCSPIG